MAATNLFQYAHMFLSHSMNGRQLLALDAMKLERMGIHDEFHRKMILSCINELIGNSETVSIKSTLIRMGSTLLTLGQNPWKLWLWNRELWRLIVTDCIPRTLGWAWNNGRWSAVFQPKSSFSDQMSIWLEILSGQFCVT